MGDAGKCFSGRGGNPVKGGKEIGRSNGTNRGQGNQEGTWGWTSRRHGGGGNLNPQEATPLFLGGRPVGCGDEKSTEEPEVGGGFTIWKRSRDARSRTTKDESRGRTKEKKNRGGKGFFNDKSNEEGREKGTFFQRFSMAFQPTRSERQRKRGRGKENGLRQTGNQEKEVEKKKRDIYSLEDSAWNGRG